MTQYYLIYSTRTGKVFVDEQAGKHLSYAFLNENEAKEFTKKNKGTRYERQIAENSIKDLHPKIKPSGAKYVLTSKESSPLPIKYSETEPNCRLANALVNTFLHCPRKKYLLELKSADFFVPCKITEQDGNVNIFYDGVKKQGQSVFVAFASLSDAQKFEKSSKDFEILKMNFKKIAEISKSRGLLLNPSLPSRMLLSPKLLDELRRENAD